MSYGLSAWGTLIGITGVFFCCMRMLRVLCIDGKHDQTAFLMMRSASLLPLGIMSTAMLLAWFALTRIGVAVLIVPWVVGRLAGLGSVRAYERGVRVVQRQRLSNTDPAESC